MKGAGRREGGMRDQKRALQASGRTMGTTDCRSRSTGPGSADLYRRCDVGLQWGGDGDANGMRSIEPDDDDDNEEEREEWREEGMMRIECGVEEREREEGRTGYEIWD